MPQTDNHEYHVPYLGDEGWAARLNENFESFETDIPLVDGITNILGDPEDNTVEYPSYTPHDAALFVSRDTGALFVGDGSDDEWDHLGGVAKATTVSATGDGAQTEFTFTHELGWEPSGISLTPQTEAAAATHWVVDEPVEDEITDGEFTVVFANAPADGASVEFYATVIH